MNRGREGSKAAEQGREEEGNPNKSWPMAHLGGFVSSSQTQ